MHRNVITLAFAVCWLGPNPGSAQTETTPPLLSPGAYDFGSTPIRPTAYEVRWIARPESEESDTGFVYMKIQDFLSEGRPTVRIEWLSYFGSLANLDLMLLDPSSYAVRYRLEPRAGGGFGIYWYQGERAYAAQVDSSANAVRHEMPLERPVFSVPTLPWVLSQLSGRIDQPVRIELPGFNPDEGGRIVAAVLRPGERKAYRPPERARSYPVREMRLDFPAGHSWTYFLSDEYPYFLAIIARNAEGIVTSQIEVLAWRDPAFDSARREAQVLRQLSGGP